MKRATKYILIISILTIGCNYIPCSSSSDLSTIRKPPQKSLIAGIYKPDKFTKEDFTEYSKSDSTILILSEDGRIVLKNFPKKTFGFGEVGDDIEINGSGTWNLISEAGKIKINTNIEFSESGTIQPSPFELYKKGSNYYILIDFGDPDVCTSVRLEQQ